MEDKSTQSNSDKGVKSASVTLPKGGGSIGGIGEKFQSNAVTGTGTTSIPIPVTPCRNGGEPAIVLSYDSGSGNGVFGSGWSLDVPSISRKTSKGVPRYVDGPEGDVYLLSGAEDLVPYMVPDGPGSSTYEPVIEDVEEDSVNYKVHLYRPRVEGLYARIEKWVKVADGDIHWRATTRDNVTSVYGRSTTARIADPLSAKRVFKWLLEETTDSAGKRIVYDYKAEDADNFPSSASNSARISGELPFANTYLKRIRYGQKSGQSDAFHFSVVFDYGEHFTDADLTSPETAIPNLDEVSGKDWPCRDDSFSDHRAGFDIRTSRLCRRITVFHDIDTDVPVPVRSLYLSYDENPVLTYLTQVIQTGYQRQGDAQNGYTWRQKSYPAVEFEYSQPVIDPTVNRIDPDSLKNLPRGSGGSYQWVDLFGEGLSGILSEQAGIWYYKRNYGNGQFGGAVALSKRPSLPSSGEIPHLTDVDGDGKTELVVKNNGINGTFSLCRGQWGAFRPYKQAPNISFDDPNLKMLDLTGDGRPDVLLNETDAFVWYENQGLDGYKAGRRVPVPWDENKGPRVVFAEEHQTVFLADMSGDGLTDIVRVRNGEVCYWPNIGYGRFGAKIVMSNGPRFDNPSVFNAGNIRFGDVDGSGTADLFYFGPTGTKFWLNQSGNGFDSGHDLAFPKVDNLTTVDVVDLLGTGTSCVVWSTQLPGQQTRQMSYVHLMSQGKPHLMTQINNNLGRVVNLTYAPSTEFYLADERVGCPWVTKLSFPVHVLKRVETIDEIGGTCHHEVYSYHHGYFDGVEREFRGFGRVETLDTESFEAYSSTPQENYVAPVRTKTWFHCGALVDAKRLSTQFASEYFQGVDTENPDILSDTVLSIDGTLFFEEKRQAYRALKGRTLRQEIWREPIGSEASPDAPYIVTESNFEVSRLQPKQDQRYAVFAVNPRESISWHYEQEADDPRITHELTLDVDEYGNVLKTCQVAYPRGTPGTSASGLPDEQTTTHLVCQVNSFFNTDPLDSGAFYRVGTPDSVRQYELGGIDAPSSGGYHTYDDLRTQVLSALNSELAYDGTFNASSLETPPKEARLFSWERYRYWNADQTAAGTGAPPAKALLHHVEQAVLTSTLAYEITGLSDVSPDTDLSDALQAAGYVSADGYWWNPGLIQHYLDTSGFHLPSSTEDPFGNVTEVTFDSYKLAPVLISDAMDNETEVTVDYRTMLPRSIEDPNGTITEALTDPLGLVFVTSVHGSEMDQTTGDTELSEYDVLEPESLAAVADSPETYLQEATTYFWYDLDAWTKREEPVQTIGLAREKHVADLAENEDLHIQVKITYSDGFGREIQSKTMALVEYAWKRIGNGFQWLELNSEEIPWLVTGRTVFNNKQKPVKQYEPFYSAQMGYEPEEFFATYGVTPVLHYDPLLRVIRTDTPKGFFSKEEFNAWEVRSYDLNDTVQESDYYAATYGTTGSELADERAALVKAEAHQGTQKVTLLDTLGRSFMVRERAAAYNPATPEDGLWLETYTRFDITGKPVSVTDPRQHAANQSRSSSEQVETFAYAYDMTQTVIRTIGMDSGDRRVLQNVMGNPVRGMDSRGAVIATEYDELHRPVTKKVTVNSVDNVVERFVYGESAGDTEYGVTDVGARNLYGRLYLHYDQAGRVKASQYDMVGQVRKTERQLRSDYKTEADWPSTEANRVALLETETFATETQYDALGRVSLRVAPDNPGGTGSSIRPTYKPTGWLDQLHVLLKGETAERTFVEEITYNARGQRERIDYGNGVHTTYSYEPTTFRMTSLVTTRESDSHVLQDISYVYDPVGNIVKLTDGSHDCVFTNNQQVDAACGYTYDAMYRLTAAAGREHTALAQNADTDATAFLHSAWAHLNNSQQLVNFTENYVYDTAGNLTQIQHAGASTYTRYIDIDTVTNRGLPRPSQGQPDFANSFDANGNQVLMEHVDSIAWDYQDRLQKVVLIPRDNNQDDAEWYVYDGSGQRVRKVRETVGYGGTTLTVEEKIYLGDAEIKRIYLTTYDENGDPISTTKTLDRTSLHVMDDKSRVALVHHWTVDTGLLELDNTNQLNTHRLRYQFGNHLGSASLELDDAGSVISYEEYLPYGGTSFVAGTSQTEVRLKEYRYSGKERDSSSGLYYYGARYYAPWVGRWVSTDPLGLKAGINDYAFVRGNPITRIDVDGRQEGESDQASGPGWPRWEDARKHQGDYNVALADTSTASLSDQSTLGAAGVDPKDRRYLADAVSKATDILRPLFDAGLELVPVIGVMTAINGKTPTGGDASNAERILNLMPLGLGTVNVVVKARAVAGAGSALKAVDKTTDAAKALADTKSAVRGTSASSRALGKALEAAGHTRPAGSAAHHIVASNAESAAPARAVLERFGIGIDDASNGVFLPANHAAHNPAGRAIHSNLHTRAYYEVTNDALSQASSREEALEILDNLRQGLLEGGL